MDCGECGKVERERTTEENERKIWQGGGEGPLGRKRGKFEKFEGRKDCEDRKKW